MTPKRSQDLLAKLAEPLEPGTFGEGAQQTRGQILVPSARARSLIGIDATEKRGEHEAEDFAEQLLLSSQAAFDLCDEVVGQAQVMESLVEGFDITLGLFLLAFVSLLSVETTPCDSFGLLFDGSSGADHRDVLRLMR
jgi:hypothetical protein